MITTEKFIDLDSWKQRIPELSTKYQQAQPFPHAVLDDFLIGEAASKALDAFPEIHGAKWTNYMHYNSKKRGLNKIDQIPDDLRKLIYELNSPDFVEFLRRLTGIKDLLPDETIDGGGLHQIEKGGFLRVHADFTVHPQKSNWKRRVNVLVYLNKDWKDEYGGHLELWSKDMKTCEAKILPVFNRCVIFNTSEDSYHGHPEPLNCPDGMTRKSVALYYFTEEKETPKNIPTNYKARPTDKKVLVVADNSLLRFYKKTIKILGINDDFMSNLIGFFKRK